MISYIINHTTCTQLLTSLCWMSSGKEFAASFYGGVIGVWSVKANKGLEKLITPHGSHSTVPLCYSIGLLFCVVLTNKYLMYVLLITSTTLKGLSFTL